jgi:hypothetical protein
MTTVSQLAQTLQTVFTTTADAAARATGFVQALVFGWLAYPHASIAALAQAAAVVGVAISPQGVDQRFSEAAAAFLEEVLGAAVQAVIAAEPVAIPLLQRFSAGGVARLLDHHAARRAGPVVARLWRVERNAYPSGAQAGGAL